MHHQGKRVLHLLNIFQVSRHVLQVVATFAAVWNFKRKIVEVSRCYTLADKLERSIPLLYDPAYLAVEG